MSRETAAEAAAVILTLGILASPVRAESIKLTNVQMDNVTAGAFIVSRDPNTLIANPFVLIGFNGQQNVTLQSSDRGISYVSLLDGSIWNNLLLRVSTTQGYADGVLIGPQGQQWDGGHALPSPLTPPDLVLGSLPINPFEQPTAVRPLTLRN